MGALAAAVKAIHRLVDDHDAYRQGWWREGTLELQPSWVGSPAAFLRAVFTPAPYSVLYPASAWGTIHHG